MSERPTVADYVVRRLARKGITDYFGVAGDFAFKIRFPKYLASFTLQRDGQTYYFVGEDTRREFEQQSAAKQ